MENDPTLKSPAELIPPIESTKSSGEKRYQFRSPDLYGTTLNHLAAEATVVVEKIKKSPNPEGYREKLRQIFAKHAGRLRKYALLGSLLALPALQTIDLEGVNEKEAASMVKVESVGGEYKFATPDQIREEMNRQDGEVMVYGSRNSETNVLLNYMTGHDVPFSDFMSYIYPHNPELILTDVIVPRLSQIQLQELETVRENGNQSSVDEWVRSLNLQVINLADFNSNDYEALWEMQGHYGSPQVGEGSVHERDGSYNILDSQINISGDTFSNPERMIDIYFAELAHHLQWSQKPVSSNKRYGKEVDESQQVALARGVDYLEAQRDQYDVPGSIEYEAHTEIQPKLEDEFWMRTIEFRRSNLSEAEVDELLQRESLKISNERYRTILNSMEGGIERYVANLYERSLVEPEKPELIGQMRKIGVIMGNETHYNILADQMTEESLVWWKTFYELYKKGDVVMPSSLFQSMLKDAKKYLGEENVNIIIAEYSEK